MANSLLSVLHLSDFHFTKRKRREQEIVVEALVADLKVLCIGHRKPDLIVFTGDLVQAGGVDGHDDAYDFLIDPVSKATGCSDERIFIVPGNHDLAWRAVEEFGEFHKEWRKLLSEPNEMALLNDLYERGSFDDAVEAKFSAFLELDGYLAGDERGRACRLRKAFAKVDHIAALNVDLVTINTAALSTGGNKRFERDEKRLVVPEYALLEAVKATSPDTFKIFATHHPYGMLTDSSAKQLEGIIAEHGDIHLFGHMHDPQPRDTAGLKGRVLSDQSGALFTARQNAYIGYSLIVYDRSNGFSETYLRTYFDDRKAFDDGVDLIEGGRWYPSQEARAYFRKLATPVDEGSFRAHLAGAALAALRAEEAASGGEGDTHERFVAPPLSRRFLQSHSGEEGENRDRHPNYL